MNCSNYSIDNCPLTAVYILVNGDDVSALCSICFKETLFNLVTENKSISIRLSDEKYRIENLPMYVLD